MVRLLIAFTLILISISIAVIVERRKVENPFSVKRNQLPTLVPPQDFGLEPEAAIIVFTESTCRSCSAVLALLRGPAGANVTVTEVEYGENLDLHRKYGIDTVPTTVLVEGDGNVVEGWIGKIEVGELARALALVV
ncbi:MAG: thioredoxin family protein [Actinomycetota bacterium]|nr:thioredoxin family protein [Actinomycetota bacterium]MDG2119692.1 thioredoxin family protein [Actinomycetota bacterium]